MTTRHTIISAGYMPLDIIRTTGETHDRRAGGTAGNVAAITAFLGWDAVLAGQAGHDRAGDELVADLRGAGVRIDQIHRPSDMLTPRVVHDVRPDGHFFLYRCPDCESRLPRTRPLTLEGAARCVQAYPSPQVFFFDRANPATVWLAEKYYSTGAVIVFEPSVPANAELLTRAATVAHVIKHSDDRSIGGLEDLHIKARPGQVRIVTHGAEGLALSVGSRRARRFPALATLAVDTGGAGDWTTAGFLSRAVGDHGLEMEKLDDAVRFGQALAAVSCAVAGARGLMALTRGTALRRVRCVLADGGLTSEPRLPPVRSLVGPSGVCPSCLVRMRPAVRNEVMEDRAVVDHPV